MRAAPRAATLGSDAMRLELFFDYSSPFGYLASTQVERVAVAHGATLEWKPVLLGALFKQNRHAHRAHRRHE